MSADRVGMGGGDRDALDSADRADRADRVDRVDRAGIGGARAGLDGADGADHPAHFEVEPADREFAATLERLGIEMPRDLAPGVLAGYRSLRAKMELLRTMETTDG
ncbi:hypothetical protein [Embleya sp. NPDC001921]